MSSRYGSCCLWLMLVMAGCREGLAPYEPEVLQTDTTGAIQLTRSSGDDLYPIWDADGSLVYSGAAFTGLPAGRGLLLAVPRHGGSAALVFPDLQGPGGGGPRWLAASAPGRAGSEVAYLDVGRVVTPTPVDTVSCPVREPLLDSAVVRVRSRGESRPIRLDPSLPFLFPGRDPAQREGSPGPISMQLLPFQQYYIETGIIPVRPSWSADGRMVVGDGVTLRIMNVAGGSPVEVPGVADAALPAWSPDGEWIAYARLERGDSVTVTCDILIGDNVSVQHIRTDYSWPRSMVVRVRPDGTGSLDLAEGTDPAWSPDGAWVYYRANDRIERVPSSGGATESVAGTEGGWWPDVSSDGGRLAFMRRSSEGSWDIWTVPLSH